MVGGWRGHEILIGVLGQQVWRWCSIWQFAASDPTSFDWQHDDLSDLDAVVWPEAVGFAENIELALVLDHHSGQGILRFHSMKVYQRVPVIGFRRRDEAALQVARVPSLEPSCRIGQDMSVGRE